MLGVVDTIPLIEAHDGYVLISGEHINATIDPDVALTIADKLVDEASRAIGQAKLSAIPMPRPG